MKPKKNSTADVAKKSLLFFQIGLMLVLFAAWQALEMKTYANAETAQTFSVQDNFLAETAAPLIVLPKPEIPVKSKIEKLPIIKDPVDFKIINDNSADEPSPIEFTKPSKPIARIIDIPTIDHSETIENIPYIVVESVPVFPGCEELSSNDQKRECMETKIRKLVHKNFNKNLAQDLGLSGKSRIQVLFKIDYLGNVVDVQASATHPKLKEEAVRVVNLFPKMKPGKQRGNPVNVGYSFPIILEVQ